MKRKREVSEDEHLDSKILGVEEEIIIVNTGIQMKIKLENRKGKGEVFENSKEKLRKKEKQLRNEKATSLQPFSGMFVSPSSSVPFWLFFIKRNLIQKYVYIEETKKLGKQERRL